MLVACLLVTQVGSLQARFIDVDITHPYYQAIDSLQEQNIISGRLLSGKPVFAPTENINRAEALKILLLSAKMDVANEYVPFPDVQSGQWFFPYVSTAYQQEIVQGFPDGKFYPATQVRRAEFLKMLFEAFEYPVVDKNEGQDWFEPYFLSAKQLRILPRSEAPAELLNRGEAAEIIYRFLATQSSGEDAKGEYRYQGSGIASYYHGSLAGNPTASGELYDPQKLTAAHRTLPLGTRLRVTNASGDFVIVKVNDRGPYHYDRVLDLSERAFTELSPLSAGLVQVDFEIFTEVIETSVSVPEQIAPYLDAGLKNEVVPESIKSSLRSASPEAVETKSNLIPEQQPLFSGTVSNLSPNYFDNILLRKPFPQKILEGTIMPVSGTVENKGNYSEIIVFLENSDTKEQSVFTAPLSGDNFSLTLQFLETGNYFMGFAFETNTSVTVAPIEVVGSSKFRRYPASDIEFRSNLKVNVLPEEQAVRFFFDSDRTKLSQLEFSQGPRKKQLYVESGLSAFDLPYDYFEVFKKDEILSIDFYQAGTLDGTLNKQSTNWKKVDFANFKLVEGFPDYEKTESIEVQGYRRFMRNPELIIIRGNLEEANLELAENAYLIDPEGEVVTLKKNIAADQSFAFSFTPEMSGKYVLEIIATTGEILFNRAFYISESEVLPVFPKEQLTIRSDNKSSIVAWTNFLRQNMDRPALPTNPNLDQVAQKYAERMARDNFISHTDPEGRDIIDRMGDISFRYVGENLSYGSDLQLAINGLENSASHRQNILSRRWDKIGVGVTQNSEGDYYVVQIFARD